MKRGLLIPIFSPSIVLLVCVLPCRAQQWTKDIDCPAGTTYRDVRPQAGRQEFCERVLPGALKVKDGPFRSWFSEGHPGDVGAYNDGREVGPWNECDRFDRCKQTVHELVFPYEGGSTGFRREIPISFQNGKYVFDFTSCWSTWVVQTGSEDLNLNIGATPYRCDIAYIPQRVLDNGGEGSYLCRVPFLVGKRELNSLDLLHELPKLGLPQFCRVQTTGRPVGEDFELLKNFVDVATAVDVQAAVVLRNSLGRELLSFTLNRYATNLAVAVAKDGPLTIRICSNDYQQTNITQDASGRSSFHFLLSPDSAKANAQKKCVSKLLSLASPVPR